MFCAPVLQLFDLVLTFLPCSRSIVLVGFLAVFYFGIFTLSLMFLDPVDNDAKNEKFDESVGLTLECSFENPMQTVCVIRDVELHCQVVT